MGASLFRLLRRALRAFQLYPVSSPVRTEAASAFLEGLQEPLREKADGISFVFLEDGTYVEGTAVHPGDGAGESPPNAGVDLFRVGVREIRFLPGIDAEEMQRLLSPLARALQGLLNPVDEDLSVLLWEADLPHVWYLLYEESRAAEEGPTGALELTGGPKLEEYLDPRQRVSREDPSRWARRLGDTERRQLVSAHRREWDHDVPVKYARLLLEILRMERRSDECAVLRRVVENQLEVEAGAGRFAGLQRVAAAVEPERAPFPGSCWALGELSSWFTSRGFLARLLETRAARPEDAEAVGALIGRFPAAPLPEGLAMLLEHPESVTAEASAALWQRLEIDAEVQSLCLRDSRPSLRRAALDRIRPTGDDLRRVREILRDRDPRTRASAVRALGRAGGAAVAGLIDALFDAEETVRTAAAESIGGSRSREGLEMLLRLMASNGFEERAPLERRAVYLAAGRLAPAEVWPILARLAERRRPSWFGRAPQLVDPALEALAALDPAVTRRARERWRRRPDLQGALDALERRGGSSKVNEEEPSAREEAA